MILVTGATGFVGSYLTRYLIKNGNAVRAIRRSSSDLSLLAEAKDKVEWIEADVLDVPSLEEAFKGIKKVYHLASLISFDPAERTKMMKVNIEGTANVVNVALQAGIAKMVYASSYSSLGRSENNDLIDENADWDKNSHDTYYSISKLQAEQEVWRGIAEGLNAVIVNPTLVLGAGKWSDSSTQLFGAVAKWQPFYPIGSTGYVDVRDVAKIMIQLMESEISGEKFILNAENLTFREVISGIARELGKNPPSFALNNVMIPIGKIFDAVRSTVTRSKPLYNSEVAGITASDFKYDNQKIRTLLNYDFISVKQSVVETVAKLRESRRLGKDFGVLEL